MNAKNKTNENQRYIPDPDIESKIEMTSNQIHTAGRTRPDGRLVIDCHVVGISATTMGTEYIKEFILHHFYHPYALEQLMD